MTDLTEVMARAMAHFLDLNRKDVMDHWREKSHAILAALDAAGYQIVPKEPTEAMIKCAVENEGADPE